MAYKWRGKSFEKFDEAAYAWLYDWLVYEGGCPTLAENLSGYIKAATPEVWKEMALSDIQDYHCGNCDLAIPRIQQQVVNRILEDIETV